MFSARFDDPRVFTDEAELQAAFACDRISLAAGARLELSGTILLARDIVFAGHVIIADGCSIDSGSILTNVRLGTGNRVRPYSILTDVDAGAGNLFGPFCFIRDGCSVGDDCILGAHVEAARSRFGSGVKISHRAFVGDAAVGAGVIIGAGVVFCNWDGQGRQPTAVGDGAVIGSGSLLVPPLDIGAGATIAAGSTVTKNVPAHSKLIQKRA
jgi:bifunctional UDP-N-acetylglucosamine pyrophosphorylase / glucosamine-1-phosphate N-acetyltransferase